MKYKGYRIHKRFLIETEPHNHIINYQTVNNYKWKQQFVVLDENNNCLAQADHQYLAKTWINNYIKTNKEAHDKFFMSKVGKTLGVKK